MKAIATVTLLSLLSLSACTTDEPTHGDAGNNGAVSNTNNSAENNGQNNGDTDNGDVNNGMMDNANNGDTNNTQNNGVNNGGAPVVGDASCAAAVCPIPATWECPSIDHCDAALDSEGGISLSEASTELEKQKDYLVQQLCDESRSTEIYDKLLQEGPSGSLGIAFQRIGLSGGTDNQELRSEGNFRSWQRNRCESAVRSATAESVATFMRDLQDTTGSITAWEECVRITMEAYTQCAQARGEFSSTESLATQGLTILGPPREVQLGESFNISLRWCGVQGSRDKHLASIKTFTHNGAECDFAQGDTLCGGDTLISCTRNSPRLIELNLNIEAQSIIDSDTTINLSQSLSLSPLCGWTQQECCDGSCRSQDDTCQSNLCLPDGDPCDRCTSTQECIHNRCVNMETENLGPDWQALSEPGDVKDILYSHGTLYRLHDSGAMYEYPLAQEQWTVIDANPATTQIAADNGALYQLHTSGAVWIYNGIPRTGWEQIDYNAATIKIAASSDDIYIMHRNGHIFSYNARGDNGGWGRIHDSSGIDIQARGDSLYRIEPSGHIYRFSGGNWTLLDNNPSSSAVYCTSTQLYQMHNNGRVWIYDGVPLTGWTEIDNSRETRSLHGYQDSIYQIRNNGRIYHYLGSPNRWEVVGGDVTAIDLAVGPQHLFALLPDGSILMRER